MAKGVAWRPTWRQKILLSAGIVLALAVIAAFALHQWRYARGVDALEENTQRMFRGLQLAAGQLLPAYEAARQAPEDADALNELLQQLDRLLVFGMDSLRRYGIGPTCDSSAYGTNLFRAFVLTRALQQDGLWQRPSLDDYAARLQDDAGISLGNLVHAVQNSLENAQRTLSASPEKLGRRELRCDEAAQQAFDWLTGADRQWRVTRNEQATRSVRSMGTLVLS